MSTLELLDASPDTSTKPKRVYNRKAPYQNGCDHQLVQRLLTEVDPKLGRMLRFTEIARLVGVSRERIRQLAAKWGYEAGRQRAAAIQAKKLTDEAAMLPDRVEPLVAWLHQNGHIVSRDVNCSRFELVIDGVICNTSLSTDSWQTSHDGPSYYRFAVVATEHPLILWTLTPTIKVWVLPSRILPAERSSIYIPVNGPSGYNNHWPLVDYTLYENMFSLLKNSNKLPTPRCTCGTFRPKNAHLCKKCQSKLDAQKQKVIAATAAEFGLEELLLAK